MPFYLFLPSGSREQRSDAGLLGISAHSVLVSLAIGSWIAQNEQGSLKRPRPRLSPKNKFFGGPVRGEARRRLVSVAGTKHCCLTAINRCGALCCPDFPQPGGLSPYELSSRRVAISRLAIYRSQLFCLTWSGIRESNPPPRLGKPMHYRCANAACAPKSAAKLQQIFQICKFFCKKILFFWLSAFSIRLFTGVLGSTKIFQICKNLVEKFAYIRK